MSKEPKKEIHSFYDLIERMKLDAKERIERKEPIVVFGHNTLQKYIKDISPIDPSEANLKKMSSAHAAYFSLQAFIEALQAVYYITNKEYEFLNNEIEARYGSVCKCFYNADGNKEISAVEARS